MRPQQVPGCDRRLGDPSGQRVRPHAVLNGKDARLNKSRCAGWDCFVASFGTAPACLAKARYGSPDSYAVSMFASPDIAAAMPNSCCDQSMYATPWPGGGLINPRSHTLGPKMNFELLGWLRPVRAWKADNRHRFRPSRPTARSLSRNSDKALRSSRSGATSGCDLAACRKASSDKSSAPVSRRGHGMPVRSSHVANLAALKVRPSNTS